MTFVLDACAVIALIRKEQGHETIRDMLLNEEVNCLMHSINLCEVYYDCVRVAGAEQAEILLEGLEAAGLIVRSDMDTDLWTYAGRLKARGRISLADTFAMALAVRENAILVTSDHHEFDAIMATGECPVKIQFIR